MKRITVFFGMALFILTLAISIGCKKNKDLENCTELISRVNAAEITYGTNPTTANCQAYKTALNNMLACPAISAQERTAYQLLFSQLTC